MSGSAFNAPNSGGDLSKYPLRPLATGGRPQTGNAIADLKGISALSGKKIFAVQFLAAGAEIERRRVFPPASD